MDAKEVRWPLVLIGVAAAIYAGYGFYVAGTDGVIGVLIGLGIRAAIGTLLGILACMITAKIMDIDFGPLDTACLKLAAVILFPWAVALLVPGLLAVFVVIILYFGLLAWLFELEGWEFVVCGVVIWAMHFAAGILASIALSS